MISTAAEKFRQEEAARDKIRQEQKVGSSCLYQKLAELPGVARGVFLFF